MNSVIDALMYWLPSILLLYVLLTPKAKLAKEIVRCEHLMQGEDDGKVPFSKYAQCYVPIWNTLVIRKSMYDKFGFFPVAYILSAMLAVTVVILFNFAPASVPLYIALNVMGALAILIFWVTESLLVFDCAVMFRMGIVIKVLGTIIPPFGAINISNNVYKIMIDSKEDLDETFEGGNSID